MHAFLWILAFIGVAMIYLVPYIGEKTVMTDKASFVFKLVGVILAAICLLALYLTDGFK